MNLPTLADYTEACNYPGRLDEVAVEASLRRYLSALGIERHIVRLRRGWSLDQHPALMRAMVGVADHLVKALDARAARDARAALAALDAQAALDARAARDARAAWDARAARDARAAWDAQAARDAQAAQDARDARDAQGRLARWMIARSHSWWSWDLSWLSSTAFGARQLRKKHVQAWAEPILAAFISGCWFLFWVDDILCWVAKPTVHMDDQRRLHCETGPAVESDSEDLYFWHGVLVPAEWIMDRSSIDASTALTWPNIEQRRVACEIVGWQRILEILPSRTIDAHPDPQIGELIEVDLPDSGKELFLRVTCGTQRQFALPMPPTVKTAMEAQAWSFGLDPSEFATPEIRT